MAGNGDTLCELFDMKRKKMVLSTPKTEDKAECSDAASIMLSMLESLTDALDSKAEEVENTGESDDEDVRAMTMRDIAGAIRERFAL